MTMNVLEVAIYAMVLISSQPKAFECVAVRPEGVNCTNGLAALSNDPMVIRFNTGVQVIKDRRGGVSLTNGLTTHFDASAWVAFKHPNGETLVSARKTGTTRFRFSNGYLCEAMDKTGETARCYKP